MLTQEELLAAQAARRNALRPAGYEVPGGAEIDAWVEALGFATLPEILELGEVAAVVEGELAGGRVIETVLWPGERRYFSEAVAAYVYSAVGDRHPRADYKLQAREGKLSWLAAEVYERLLGARAGLSSDELRGLIGTERTSILRIEHALLELAMTLKVVRAGRQGGHEVWTPWVMALPEVVEQAQTITRVQAAAALATKYLDLRVCATEEAMAEFHRPLFSRARVHEALHGLETAGEIVPESLDGQKAWKLR